MTNSESLVYKIDRIEVNDKYLTLWNYGDGLIKTISFPPPLAGISKEVESIANIAHGLDGSVHYLDDPEHGFDSWEDFSAFHIPKTKSGIPFFPPNGWMRKRVIYF